MKKMKMLVFRDVCNIYRCLYFLFLAKTVEIDYVVVTKISITITIKKC